MKKTISLGIGFIFLAGALLPFSEASRNTYHSYFFSQKRISKTPLKTAQRSRKFSKRRYAFSIPLKANSHPPKPLTRQLAAKASKYTPQNIRNTFASVNFNQLLKARKSLRWTTAEKQNQNNHVVYYKNIGGDIRTLETYSNDSFSIQVPHLWHPVTTNKDNLSFISPSSEFTVSVTRLADNCQGVSFTACSIDFSKNINREKKLFTTSKINRRAHVSNAELNSAIKNQMFTESFLATNNGEKEVFINRYFVKSSTNGIFLIETNTPSRLATNFIDISKKIFDSFRIL